MKEIITKVFTYEELSDEAKKKAVSECYDINVDDDWYEPTYEEFNEKLIKLGYSNIEPRFSGFSSQGDGASFQADIDLSVVGQRLTNKVKDLFDMIDDQGVTVTIEDCHCGNYVHENTKQVSMNGEIEEDENCSQMSVEHVTSFLCMLESQIEAERYALCKELYSSLNSDYDYWTSDTQIASTLKDNPDNYEFLEDGSKH